MALCHYDLCRCYVNVLTLIVMEMTSMLTQGYASYKDSYQSAFLIHSSYHIIEESHSRTMAM